MVRFYSRLIGWVSALLLSSAALVFSFEAYAVTTIAFFGTLYWVFGSERYVERATQSTGLLRALRMACYSDDIFGGGLVGMSVLLQGISQVISDF